MGLKEQLLQRNMAALRETLEKREAQLYAALSTAGLDPSAASDAANKLQVPLSVGLSPFIHQRHQLTGLFLILGHSGVQRSRRGGPAEGAERRLRGLAVSLHLHPPGR